MPDSAAGGEAGVVTRVSPLSVTETVSRLTHMLSAKGMKLFAVIDQRDEARQVGLDLRETTLVMFGNPAAGTPVMVASPLAALDLPLKVLVWADGPDTKVSYQATPALASRYGLTPDVASNLAGIDPLPKPWSPDNHHDPEMLISSLPCPSGISQIDGRHAGLN